MVLVEVLVGLHQVQVVQEMPEVLVLQKDRLVEMSLVMQVIKVVAVEEDMLLPDNLQEDILLQEMVEQVHIIASRVLR